MNQTHEGKQPVTNVLFVSLGCDKNKVDSEHMLSILRRNGFTLTDDEAQADVVVVNSCCFIRDAMEESINTIIELGSLKETGRLKALIVAGCLAERFEDDIRKDLPEVDGIVGTNSYDAIVSVIQSVLATGSGRAKRELTGLCDDSAGRTLTTGGHYEYLKIAEGCDKNCTYCVIPSIRGRYRSIPMERLIEEAKTLAADGVQELVLVAQEVTLYGVDLYGKKSLPELLERLQEIDGLRWIRLLYCYPEEIDGELIAAMARLSKVCHYIDMPIQHADDTILRRMGRRTSREDIERVIHSLRTAMPDIAIRTTVICGFPGESEEAHRTLLRFIEKMRFDRLGAFAYSQEEGTPAYGFDDQIDEDTKNARVEDVMLLQMRLIEEDNEALIGSRQTVFIEGKVADEDNVYIGRTYRDAPDVDGYVFVECPYELYSGRFIETVIDGVNEYDLIGTVLDE